MDASILARTGLESLQSSVVGSRPLTLRPSVAAKEKRLAALLAETPIPAGQLMRPVRAAQVAGTLALSGIDVEPAEVEAGCRGEPVAGPVSSALRAFEAVPPEAALDLQALLAWQAAFTGARGLRQTERVRSEGPRPAPPEWIETRLLVLLEWLAVSSAQELTPSQRGALALARLVEIAPFEDGNGRVARLAASHLMVQGGVRPPVLLGPDGPGLREALQAAFRIETGPLVLLLEEASERALDLMLAAADSIR